MTDKPKRKRTPSRRRKFLLMIALPILALIAGYVALKPQMDAWLATDPFTPQCHFEQDRLFAIGTPLEFITNDIDQTHPLTEQQLQSASISPNGQYVMKSNLNTNIDTYSIEIVAADGTTLHQLGDSYAYSFVGWSPNSQYYVYVSESKPFGSEAFLLLDIKTGQTIDFGLPLHDHGIIDWSPDGRYLLLESTVLWEDTDGNYNDSHLWSVADLEQVDPDNAFLSLHWTEQDEDIYIGWSSDHRAYYSIIDNLILQTNVETRQSIEILQLPYTYKPHYGERIFYVSPQQQLVIYSDEFPTLFVDLNTKHVTEIEFPIQQPYSAQQSPNGRYISFEVGSTRNRNTIYKLYDIYKQGLVSDVELHQPHQPKWFSIDGEDYLLTSNQEHSLGRFRIYLWNLNTDHYCKLGQSRWKIEFNPERTYP